MATSSNPAAVTLLVLLRPPYHCLACLPVYRDYVDHGASLGTSVVFMRAALVLNAGSAISDPRSVRRRLRQKDYGIDEAYLASQDATYNAQTDDSSCNHQLSPPATAASPTQGLSAPVHADATPTVPPPDTSSQSPRSQQPSPGSDNSPLPLVRRPRRQRQRQHQRRRNSNSTDSQPRPADTNALGTTTEPTTAPVPTPTTSTHGAATTTDHPTPASSAPRDNAHSQVRNQLDQPPTDSTPAAPPSWVIAWRDRFNCALDIDMLEVMVDDLTNLAQSMAPQQHPQRSIHQHQRHPHHPRPQAQGNTRRQQRYNAAEASRIQRLYRANKHKAFEEITRGPSRYCNIGESTLINHFTNTSGRRSVPQDQLAASLPQRPQPTTSNPLCGEFTPAKVAKRLAKCRNTAPGPDGVRYYIWKRLDPQGHILSALFNAVQRIGATPSTWKTSTTILLHKKGDQGNINNWRPIALANTLGKVYSACIASRLLRWCEENNIISAAQKGFMRYDGCSEHTFTLQSAIQNTRRKNHGCHVAWLDLANAFGSVPHDTIYTCLEWCGLDESSIHCIKALLDGCNTRIRSTTGLTTPIPILAGVKQGCPLSPILFNIVVEPALRLISDLKLGYHLHNQSISVLAYADDITIISGTAKGLQTQLDLLSTWPQNCGLTFKPAKCATLSIASKYRCDEDRHFSIQDTTIPHLKKDDHYHHLGIPTGFTVGCSAETVIDGILTNLKHVDSSRLAPWQKIDCVSTFLISRLTFYLILGSVQKKSLGKLDKSIKRYVKKWMYLPQRASPEIIAMPHAQGGANITPCGILAYVAQVSHAINLLHSRDPVVAALAGNTLRLVVEKRIKRPPSDDDVCTYLSGSMENEFGLDPYDIPSVWTRLRMATHRLKKYIDLVWQPNADGTFIPSVNEKPLQKATAMKFLSDAVKATLRKPDQGKTYRLIARNANSNHFLHDGSFTRFADWRFVHRARLRVVPLRGLQRFGNASQNCRRCQRHCETLAHVVNHCPPNFSLITKRHNSILNRLYNAIDRRNLTVFTNQRIPDYPGTCCPDLVIVNSNPKTATIVDVATPFENGEDAFDRARNEKVSKYRPGELLQTQSLRYVRRRLHCWRPWRL
ncbi:uncharacterized protein LOC111632225 [Centruroides sculpturatus]|uniref:uncharacterized protein LOC111632225 n=1 Tax=Centruroides sculpturatus TaxID=218467 RepID=UPI000C6E0487|nr:uncharacterized protein LOC111632225 [Centruroides sculpturatus]